MDITVEDILKTFQGVERKQILSSADTDDFLTTLQKKQHWTIEEYKIFYCAIHTEYMNVPAMDHMRMHQIKDKYKFTTDWSDYFYILDNIKDEKKQSEYADYYFWYHGNQLTEEVYLELMRKNYFFKVSKDSRVRFLENNMKADNSMQWVDKYFTKEEIQAWLNSDKVRFHVEIRDEAWQLDHSKIEKVKAYYNRYESLMTYHTKVVFFNAVVQRGSIELIKFLYNEKKIKLKSKDKMRMFWHLCGDTSVGNVVEVLTELKDMGMKFTPYDLTRTKNHSQWGYMDHNDQLEHFFDMLEKEKNYKALTKKLATNNSNSSLKVKTTKI